MATYTFILRSCPDPTKATVAQLLGKAFSLKDSTCASIADSAPIVLLPDLTREEAAAMHLVLSGFTRLGATVEFSDKKSDDLPKIDWPRRPQVFKRDIADYLADYQLAVPAGSGTQTLLSLLLAAFPGNPVAATDTPPTVDPAAPIAQPAAIKTPVPGVKSGGEFRGIQLPEITPFGGVPSLPPSQAMKTTPGSGTRVAATTTPASGTRVTGAAKSGDDDTLARLNELFPEEESSGFIPNNQDITSILNKLLPDEDGGFPSSSSGISGSGRRATVAANGAGGHAQTGWAVFLAKIADEGRRQKAVPLIAELAKISPEDAETLSKKVIIPVLKGATQSDAETAKQKFAKIGILARVKGPE